ncbi:hypothetical protein [Halobacillus mangrovi]|uniref:hypothetical protein n=1 Tax=Halobacillus mangrovi TaxID=402384 RepID=UPI003D9872F0
MTASLLGLPTHPFPPTHLLFEERTRFNTGIRIQYLTMLKIKREYSKYTANCSNQTN